MRNPKGYATLSHPDHKLRECDTSSCNHCNRVIHVPVGARAEDLGARCKSCMQDVCAKCSRDDICVPFPKRLEIWELHHTIKKTEASGAALRSYGLS